MVEVKILGPGCPNCKRLEAMVRRVVQVNHLKATIEKVEDYAEIMKWPILSTPGLVVNDRLVAAGRLPGEPELVAWLAA